VVDHEARVLLIGVVHRDPDGYRRLLSLLRREEPERVTVELSPHSVRWRRGPGRALARALRAVAAGENAAEAPRVRELLAVLRLPFEYRAARAYCRESGARLALLDLSRYARPKLESFEAGVREELARLAFPPERGRAVDPGLEEADARGRAARRRTSRRGVAGAYRRALAALRDPERCYLPLANEEARAELARRDAHASRRLLDIASGEPWAKVAHIAGWEHLVLDDRRLSLWARLRRRLRPRPRRVLLCPREARPS